VTIGFRILPAPEPAPVDLVRAFAQHCSSHLADSMSHLQAASGAIRPWHRSRGTLCGPALTVRAAPGDNLLVQKAVDMARRSDVIVVDVGGFTDQAVVGELMSRWALWRGVAGFVVDGAIRDLDYISAADMPVYARASTPRGPSRVGPGEINVPVSIGGMVVHPGDLIVGDSDGVVAVPLADAQAVLKDAQTLRDREAIQLTAIADGTFDRNWIDRALHSGGCAGI